MQAALNIILVVIAILISMMAVSNTVAITEGKGKAYGVAPYNFYVAQPDNMKTFPVELVPVP